MGGHEERELSSVFQVLPQFALKARGIVSMRGWEMRGRILIMQRVGDEGGICVVAESCHQTSGGIGLMASFKHVSSGKRFIKSEIRKIYLPVIQRAA